MDAQLAADLAELEQLVIANSKPADTPEGAEPILGMFPAVSRLRTIFEAIDKLNAAGRLECDWKQPACLQQRAALLLDAAALAATLTETKADDQFVEVMRRLLADETVLAVLAAVLARVVPMLDRRGEFGSDDAFRFAVVQAMTASGSDGELSA